MGVAIRVVACCDALYVSEHGLHRATDQVILAKAIAESRIVIRVVARISGRVRRTIAR